MAVIQSVSKLSDTHLHKESMQITCRAEGWVRLSRWHFLLSLMITSCCLRSFSFRGIAVFVTVMAIGQKERHFCSLSCLFISPWWFCTTQFFPCRELVGAISAALRFILLFVSPCWLFCVCTETDLRPTALPRMFCLCSGCLPSSLSLFWCSLDGHQDFLGIGDEGYGTKTFSKLVKERFWMFGVPHAMLHAAFVCQFKVCLV